MSELSLVLLGNRIRCARKECGLTQKELAEQTGLSVKMIQDIEKGRKNPTYDTLTRLMERLGLSPDTVFLPKAPVPTEEMRHFFENFQLCDQKGQEILLKTLRFRMNTLPVTIGGREQRKGGESMSLSERRQRLLEVLCLRRHDTQRSMALKSLGLPAI